MRLTRPDAKRPRSRILRLLFLALVGVMLQGQDCLDDTQPPEVCGFPNGKVSSTPSSGYAPLTVTSVVEDPGKDEDGNGVLSLGCRAGGTFTGWGFHEVRLGLSHGDGKSEIIDPYVPGTPIEHTYPQAGVYKVTAIVTVVHPTRGSPQVGQFEQLVEVLSESVTAAFTATPAGGPAPLTVQFTDQSTTTSGAPFSAWEWAFGDGLASLEQNPTHVYTYPGTYTAILTAHAGSDQAGAYQEIVVSEKPPTADFVCTPLSGVAPLEVSCTDTSTVGTYPLYLWEWSFHDGQPEASEQNPTRVFGAPGVYTVELRILSMDQNGVPATGNTAAKADYITVYGLPAADFTATPKSGGDPLSVQFTDTSNAGGATITDWAWSFGDGATSTAPSPTHVYAAPGLYDVSLTVTTTVGQDTEVKPGFVRVLSSTPVLYDDFDDNTLDAGRWQVVSTEPPVEVGGELDLYTSASAGAAGYRRVDATATGYRMVQADLESTMSFGLVSRCLEARWLQSGGDTLVAAMCINGTTPADSAMVRRAEVVNESTGAVVFTQDLGASAAFFAAKPMKLGYDSIARRIDFVVDGTRLATFDTSAYGELATGAFGGFSLSSTAPPPSDYGYFNVDNVWVAAAYTSP